MVDTSDEGNNGPIIVVFTISGTVLTLCVALIRAYTTIRRKKGVGVEDLTFFLAATVCIPQSVLIDKAVQEGLGQHITALSPSLALYFKYIYAGNILSIVCQLLAKTSVLCLVGRIDPQPSTRKNLLIAGASVGVWALFSLFALAFQCGLPRPWEFTNRCADGGKLLYAIDSINIFTDAVLSFIAVPVVWNLHMETSTRRTIAALFMLRLIVCIGAGGHIAALEPYLSSEDKTWHNTYPTILNQVVTSLSVITASIPSIHRFLTNIQTGRMDTAFDAVELAVKSSKGSVGGKYGKLSVGSSGRRLSAAAHRKLDSEESPMKLVPETGAQRSACAYATPHPLAGCSKRGEDELPPEDRSTSSLKKNGVYQKRDFVIQVETEGDDEVSDEGRQERSLPATRRNMV